MYWLQEHSNRKPVYVGECDGKVICWAAMNQYSSEYYYAGVGRIELHIDQTIGTAEMYQSLMKFMEIQAKELGYHKLMVRIVENNRTLLHQYRNMGFRDVGTLRNHGFYQGNLVNMVLLERILPVDIKKLTQAYRDTYTFYDEYFINKDKKYEQQMIRNGMMRDPEDPSRWISEPTQQGMSWQGGGGASQELLLSLGKLAFDKMPKEDE